MRVDLSISSKSGATCRAAGGGAFVGADAHIGPAECSTLTEICGEFAASKRADRVVGPYNEALIPGTL